MILASRTQSKVEAVAKDISKNHPKVKINIFQVDLSSQKSIRNAAKLINDCTDRIDILINNAGIVLPQHAFTEDGIEMQFGTNHIGPFLLTNLLLPKMRKAASISSVGSTRIVNVTSAGHVISPIRFSDYNFRKEVKSLPEDEKPGPRARASFMPKDGETYSLFHSYGQSKTGNVLMSLYLTEHLSTYGILSYSVHPGSIWTDLSRHLDDELRQTISKTGDFWKSLDQGSSTMMVAAFDPTLNKSSGHYLSDCKIAQPADHANDLKAAEKLWHLSEELVGQKFDLDNA